MARTLSEEIVGSVGTGKDPTVLDKLEGVSGASIPSGTQQAAIADVTVTGTYATDDDAIETAINSIIAVLLEYDMIAAA